MTDCENASLGGNQSPGERWKRVWKSQLGRDAEQAEGLVRCSYATTQVQRPEFPSGFQYLVATMYPNSVFGRLL
ncbi:uncharacterized protein N7529_009609 [Penicillium soppii]|uniref:uncharacterized protein n=1 Tax=Penicillium soppii TaxID=69789 RepID=UPI002548B31C|nr:uncharacterized protein N7529_009609 [Penicillium soppii]KAJ5855665.1 hypothetical protein N7529_009609 [Penicillium soppii]